jgi:hypothetical protein
VSPRGVGDPEAGDHLFVISPIAGVFSFTNIAADGVASASCFFSSPSRYF